jgi:hypothetical protein
MASDTEQQDFSGACMNSKLEMDFLIKGIGAFIKKDVYAEMMTRPFLALYTLVTGIWIVCAAFYSDSTLFSVPGVVGISAASQSFGTMSGTNSFFIPLVVYMYAIQGEKRYGSFVLYRILPIDIRLLLGSRILSCWLLSIIPFVFSYFVYLFLVLLKVINRDPLTATFLDIRFPILIVSLTLFVSTLAVGIAFTVRPQMLPFVVTMVAMPVVLFPFIFSSRVVGVDSQYVLLKLLENFGTMIRLSVLLLVLSVFFGSAFYWLFRRKRSYV